MLILGIDPGSRHTGFGVVKQRGRKLEAVQFGRFSASRTAPLAARLGTIAADLEELLRALEPGVVAIESTFLGMNPRSLVVLSQARGALLGVVGRREIEVHEYSPAEVKNAVTGNGRADKGQVSRMVRTLLDLPDDKVPEDATDALAVAICCAHRRRFEQLEEASRG
ncbi:MAG: crossover junction endodeoxyribonuclease RuvC [Acidobacteria bacterium]|nr:crossover junction endodeoxyribonuclease RuvC [Acidobacteriota bacterium]